MSSRSPPTQTDTTPLLPSSLPVETPQPRMSSYTMMSVLIIIRGTTTTKTNRLATTLYNHGAETRPTPHDRPHAGNQLYEFVLDARVGFLAKAALECRRGEADCGCVVVSFSYSSWNIATAFLIQFIPEGLSIGWRDGAGGVETNVPRARKRSSEGMQMALRRRTVTGERRGRLVGAAGRGG